MPFPFFTKATKIACTKIITFLFCNVVFFSASAQQPFRYDNILYKAVYWNDAVRLMHENKNYLLLDVRSPGEYADTSRYTHMNMGSVKGAVNIDVDSVAQHLQELKKYSNENIFVYCSHSQRSRRVSKLLSENGFKNVYNINGGMSVANESSIKTFPLKNTVIVNDKPYKNIASADALEMIENKETVIIDVRNKNEFNSKDSTFIKNLGHLKNAINIPFSELKEKFKALNIAKERTILLYDVSGFESSDAAIEIAKQGYMHVYNLFEGLAGFLCDNYLASASIKRAIINPPPYNIVSIRESINLLSKPNNFLIIDARPVEEFTNKSPKEYLNNGRIKNAVNVSSVDALTPVINSVDKDAPILVYGSYGSNNDVDVCKTLVEKGYTNVYFLYEGIGRFSWACFNIENCKDGINLLTDHKGLY